MRAAWRCVKAVQVESPMAGVLWPVPDYDGMPIPGAFAHSEKKIVIIFEDGEIRGR